MLVEVNWGNFRAKFNGKEQKSFEWFCSLLFYKEYHHSAGALRYFNQAGIEADPITVGEEVVGWQAKFISSSIAKYKEEFIKAINSAKEENPTLTRICFYLNVDFSPSPKPGVKDPSYKTKVEAHAKSKGVNITWKTAGFFETPFVCEDNANIAKHFFTLGKSAIDFIQELSRHTKAILEPIRSEIACNGTVIKIDRSSTVARLKHTLANNSLVIVSGEAGVGKTAVIKDFYNAIGDTTPFFVFKATEFNISNANQLFKDYGNFTLSDLVQGYQGIEEKYTVIDSAEKLSDIERPEVFQEFLSTLRNGGWKIIFTTRLNYLDDLKYAFIQIYNVTFEPLNIPNLTREELQTLSNAYGFTLPQNERLLTLLQNPFYLNEYLLSNPKGNTSASYADFKATMWNRHIAKWSYRKNNAHKKREECFLEMAHKRATSGYFFVTIEGSDEALQQLESDEIIKFDSSAGGYFVTHDIYEEWALDKIIERAFRSAADHEKFYHEIGSALAIRRAFRSWLSEKLASSDSNATKLIEATIDNDGVDRHWKDEVIVAALLSNYAATFVDHFELKLLGAPEKVVELSSPSGAAASALVYSKHEKSLLHKILFLLRIACKEVDQDFLKLLGIPSSDSNALPMFLTKPKGSGWSSIISFINKHKKSLGLMYMRVILPVLDDWNRYHKRGETTRNAGQIALFYFNELTKKDGHLPYGSRDEVKDQLIRTIFNGSSEIGEELRAIFDEVIAKKDTDYRGRYYELVQTALSSLTESAEIAQILPKDVIALADLFWPYTPPKRESWHSEYRNDLERYFNLANNHSDYYPASAFQTPMFRLLQVAPQNAVDFIIAFTNKSIEYFAKSEFARHEVEEVEVFPGSNEESTKQYICHRIWNIYRGTQVAPVLLESIHMALERWLLLVLAKTATPEVLEGWCLYLIKHSRSASITAVVASVALAEPSKLFNVAQVLFRTKDFFFYDTGRMQLDMSAKSTYAISHDPSGLFTNERLKTCEDAHRNMSLEHLALNYQLFRSASESEEAAKQRQEAIWKILDYHYAQLPDKTKETEADKTWRLYLARMDKRKLSVTTENKNDKVLISFNPDIDPELRRYSEESLAKNSDVMKYIPLQLWARHRFERNENEYKKYLEYNNDHKRVISATKDVLGRLSNDESDEKTFTLFYHSVPPCTCAVLIRDYCDQLDAEEKEFCKNTILEYASMPMQGGYRYQIGDGMDVAINVLPLLLKPFPQDAKKIKGILLFTLFDSYPIGMSRRFSDYSVTAISQNMWEDNPVDANSLFLGHLLLKPTFDVLYEAVRKENYKKNIYDFSISTVQQRFATEHEPEIMKVLTNRISYEEIPSLDDLSANTLVTSFLLIPLRTTNENHKKFARAVSAILAKRILEHDDDEERFDHALRHLFFEKLAFFVLHSGKEDIANYMNPFVANFESSREAESYFSEFVSAEDKLHQYDAFWTVWELFYPKMLELCKDEGTLHSSNVVHNYLLAWPYWNKGAKEWHSLKEREKAFFKRVAEDIGGHPAVLYSLSKLLNEIGSSFVDDGMVWISGILEKNPDLGEKELEVNTVYYLENLVRGYILKNRHKIRITSQIKKQILTILNFLLEKGSVTAYVLREDIL